MRIKEINLYTNKLEAEKHFYTQILGFELVQATHTHFTVKVGWTALSFTSSPQASIYHYCFLVPCNQLLASLAWVEKRTNIIHIERGQKIQYFEDWNAESFYFYDASGNLAEFIVKYDLDNRSTIPFQASSVVCVNEIGLPTTNISKTNNELRALFGTEFWKGNLHRFGTNGDLEGLFLLPNPEVKNQWFPTNQLINMEPFDIAFEDQNEEYHFQFRDGRILHS